jgi:hypothetical protein
MEMPSRGRRRHRPLDPSCFSHQPFVFPRLHCSGHAYFYRISSRKKGPRFGYRVTSSTVRIPYIYCFFIFISGLEQLARYISFVAFVLRYGNLCCPRRTSNSSPRPLILIVCDAIEAEVQRSRRGIPTISCLQLVVSPALRGHFAENTEGESSTKNIRRELNEDSSSHQLPKDIERLPRSALGTESVYCGLRSATQLPICSDSW